jgi:hypothetical protein
MFSWSIAEQKGRCLWRTSQFSVRLEMLIILVRVRSMSRLSAVRQLEPMSLFLTRGAMQWHRCILY